MEWRSVSLITDLKVGLAPTSLPWFTVKSVFHSLFHEDPHKTKDRRKRDQTRMHQVALRHRGVIWTKQPVTESAFNYPQEHGSSC